MGNKTVSFDDFPIAIYMMSWSPQVSGSQREEQRSRPPPWKQQESHQDKRPRERECPSYIFGVKVFFYKLGLVIWNMSPILLYMYTQCNESILFEDPLHLTPRAAISWMSSMEPWGNWGAEPTSITVFELSIRIVERVFYWFWNSVNIRLFRWRQLLCDWAATWSSFASCPPWLAWSPRRPARAWILSSRWCTCSALDPLIWLIIPM